MIKKILKFISNSKYRFMILASHGFYNYMSDKEFLKKKYKILMKKNLDLNNPKTYNEKIQWLKIYDRNEKYVKLVDKFEVKDYVSNIIGNEYVIPTLGVWKCYEEIDFEKLPNKFVLKCTHDSGGIYIISDKNEINHKKLKKKINKNLKNNFYYRSREWPYSKIDSKIIAEPYLEDNKYKELRDYKFFCFNGVPKLMFIASNRQGKGETYFDFFDMNSNYVKIQNGHLNAPVQPELPVNFKKMIDFSKKLSKDIKHVRVDFYEVNGKVYFGELTFYHWSGFVPFNPEKWDKIMGDWIDLS